MSDTFSQIKNLTGEKEQLSKENSDLLNSLYFVAKLPKLDRSFLNDNSDTDGGDGWKLNYVRWVNYIGNVLIKKVRYLLN